MSTTRTPTAAPTTRPEDVPTGPQRAPPQRGTHTQVPNSQVWWKPQVPQLPPQPSLPQSRPLQSGTHWHCPMPLHCSW